MATSDRKPARRRRWGPGRMSWPETAAWLGAGVAAGAALAAILLLLGYSPW